MRSPPSTALRDVLDQELGIDPSPALQRLHERILRQDPGLSRSMPPGQQPDAPVDAPVGARPSQPVQGVAGVHRGRRGGLLRARARRGGDPGAARDHRFLALVGPSGSGKSSVVRAGVLPALRDGDRHGRSSRLEPGPRFVADRHDGAGVAPVRGRRSRAPARDARPPGVAAEQFRGDDLDLLRAVLRIRADDDTRVLLVIDQFEELYLLVDDPQVRQRFARNLVEAVEDPAGS
jgi:hypothetical protein